ncbi:olfactory receptor 5V1-like [Pseudophryne corroboree]|uniref:olfactory receptor 5V1-like n=1 Tax=Pseudophryne corroboree TaxID=495146 RepID=UPI0030815B4D
MNETIYNDTIQGDFYLLAFSRYPQFKFTIFSCILLMYLLCILGNMLVTIIVFMTPQLHTPMYFFLCNLTVLDIIYVTAILPKLLIITITDDISISYSGCFIQVFLYVFCIGTEFFLLTSMAYDRYVAICIPLHYILIMNKKTCLTLSIACCQLGIFNALMYPLLLSKQLFTKSHEINHFFCHMKSILNLSVSDSSYIGILITVDGIVLGFLPFVLILTSYMYIISKIVKIHTTSGRWKAFSSCSSHLIIVLLFCLTSLSLNMKPESELSQEQDKLLSMLYIAITPMLNPLVYSLRNKEVLKAINRRIYKKLIVET